MFRILIKIKKIVFTCTSTVAFTVIEVTMATVTHCTDRTSIVVIISIAIIIVTGIITVIAIIIININIVTFEEISYNESDVRTVIILFGIHTFTSRVSTIRHLKTRKRGKKMRMEIKYERRMIG